MRKLVITCITLVLLISVLLGHAMFTSMAGEDKEMRATPYFKSVQIQDGDSLWKLANYYKEGSSMSTHEYVAQLNQMNSPKKDDIHAGQYLTVVYFEK